MLKNKELKIVEKFKMFICIALVVVLLGGVFMLVRVLGGGNVMNFGIDFTGGAVIDLDLSTYARDAEVQKVIKTEVGNILANNEYGLRVEGEMTISNSTEGVTFEWRIANQYKGTTVNDKTSEEFIDFSVEIPVVGSQDFGNAWAAGVTVHFSISVYGIPFNYDITVNESVDDAGFILAALDAVRAEHAICADSVFFAGFSLGGFMCHRMAIEHGDLINGIAAVSGLVGNDMQTLTPVDNVNILQLYGTDDERITYDGAMVSYQNYGSYNVGLPVEETVDYWRNFNHCNAEAIFEQYPDIQNDGLTFEMHSYLYGDNNTRVGFLKVNNGLHRWYTGDAYDIDYNDEIVKFFTNTLDVTSVAEQSEADFSVWPNPAKDFIYIESQNEASIYDLTGQLVLKGKGRIDIQSLANGLYFVKAGDVCRKLVIKK